MASKSSIEAGRGHVTLATDQTLLDKGLAAATATVQSWGKGIMSMGAGLAAAGAAITTPMLKGLDIFIEMSGSALSASRRTGIGFEAIQGIAAGLRVDMEGLARSMMHMGVFLEGLAHGSHEATQAVRELGLDANRLLTGTEEERIRSITEAIAGMTDASQRGAMARRIFGRQAFEMNFGGGVAGLRGREARARELGGVISERDKQVAQDAVYAQKELAMSIRGLWASVGAAAAPVMADFWRIITRIIVAIRVWTENNRPLLTTIFRIADAMVTIGTIVGVLGGAVYASSYIFLFLSGAIAIVTKVLWLASGAFIVAKVAIWLYNAAVATAQLFTWGWAAGIVALGAALAVLPVLAIAATVAIVTGAEHIQAAGIGIAGAWTRFWSGLVSDSQTAFWAIRNAFNVGDWETILDTVLIYARLTWERIKTAFFETWYEIKYGTIRVWYSVADTFTDIWTGVTGAISDIFEDLWNGVKSGFFRMMLAIVHEWNANYHAMASTADRLNPLLSDAERGQRGAARLAAATEQENAILALANQAAAPAAERNAADRANAAAALAIERERRNNDLMREQLAAIAQAGGNVADLQEQLRQLGFRNEADPVSALLNAALGVAFGGEGGPGGRMQEAAKGMILGGFSAQQAFGFLGATTTAETPIARLARIEEQVRDELIRQRQVLQLIAERAGARFG